jgi:hypothetical protein
MNSLTRCFVALMLSSVFSIGVAQAASYPLDVRSNNSPNDGAIRRANPNSQQGTQSSIPGQRSINTPNNPRPTLENGGVGNGYPPRQPPSTSPSSTPSRDSTR